MENDVNKFLSGLDATVRGKRIDITVGGRHYRIRQISNKVREKIALLVIDEQILDSKGKNGTDRKEARKITKALYSVHAKMAAYYILGNWALFVPFLWAFKWRWMKLHDYEALYQICSAGAVSGDLGFFKASWDFLKQAQELIMRPAGDAARETRERLANTLNMLEKDALGIKEESK